MKIRKAKIEDAKLLSEIAFESKSFWGYPQEWLDMWKDGLTIKSAYILANELYCLTENEEVLGWFALEFIQDSRNGDLGHFWLRPSKIGKGLGKVLMEKAISLAKEFGFEELVVVSDPNAQRFYEKFGFELFDKLESQPKGRFLPVLKRKIKI
jgi:N-acetylglutamate synthase-like GNAT family acetyltransferase